jgi:type II secretory ATPase GspE/PulE/Tfp pilus assembly ATPase PilB-like protein
MAMSPTLRRMILQGASTAELRDQAIAEGMLTLRMDGMLKVRQGDHDAGRGGEGDGRRG